ncbi:PP2C family serine/threonine-protein phosphatase [Streptomyces sp. ICC4]|uniref:PP2C family serine/threonine-protein phosphatase n=1 Tax=Streptomyces sp. ICC4 TaxID=2099584 RepID=UPI000DC75E09|nr:PP2C family serine/threonine-protein phosphatase [Streptomyces sp. ICC4]AWZ10499.1 phosphatase [Streptomyces sp. ICC4]
MSMHRPSGCPSCAEPLEEGDRFCGFCGHALTASGPAASAPTGPAAAVTAPAPASAPVPPPAPAPLAPAAEPADPAAGIAAGGIPAGVPATRGRPAPDEVLAPLSSGGSAPGGYGAPAAAGYPGGEPAPGWGSTSTAAPTLVSGVAGWTDPAPADAHATAPRSAAPDGGPDPAPDARSRYDGPVPQPQHPAGGAPYGAAAPQGPDPFGPTVPLGQGSAGASGPAGASGHEGSGHAPEPDGPYGDPGPGSGPGSTSGSGSADQAPYGAPAPQGDGSAHEAPYGGGEPESGGKTCVACRAGRVDTDGYCEHCGHAQPRERDHLEEELGSVAAVSDRGLRHHRNEDSFAVAATALPDGSAATVAIVCDGVSSASRPDEASAAAAGAANEALLEALPRGAHPQEAMHEAILAAAAAVNALAPEVPGAQNAPACTLVGAVVSGGLLTIGWVGDSRAYWVPDDRAALPRRLTEDDSWAAQMVAAGLMGEAEAYADVRAHAITGWLGADAYDLEPHTATFKPDHDGVVVVCTDGLWNYAESARDLAQVLPSDAAVRPLHSAQVLVGHALDGGGHDNVTVAVVPFSAPPQSPSASPAAPQAQA